MRKSQVRPVGSRVSHFAQPQNLQGEEEEQHESQKHSSLRSISNSEVSNPQNQTDQLLPPGSQRSIDIMKQQEEILRQKGKLHESPHQKQRRFSVDSKMSESAESEANSDSDKDSDPDEHSVFGSPEHLTDNDNEKNMPPQLNLESIKKESDGKEALIALKAGELDLKLTKGQSKQSKKEQKEALKKEKSVAKKKAKKSKKQKQVYKIDDFTITNSVGRNILHRQCLKQNSEIIQDLLKQYKKLKEMEQEQNKNQFVFDVQDVSADVMLKEYVNQMDSFFNSPLILCCIQDFDEEVNNRYDCLKLLLEAGADVNHRNPRTLWSAIHWCAHYGDDKSIGLLLNFQKQPIPTIVSPPLEASKIEKPQEIFKTYQCFPDQEGLYPIDLAGLNGYQEAVHILVEHLIADIKDVDKNIQQYINEEEDEIPYYQKALDQKFMRQQRAKYLRSPLLKSRLIYWAACFPGEKSKMFIKSAFGFTQVYVMAKNPHQANMTSLHAAAKYKNSEALQILSDNIRYKYNTDLQRWMEKQLFERNTKLYSFNIYTNSVLPMIPNEKELYKERFISIIKKFAIWENEFILTYRKYKQNPTMYTFIDQKDSFGNTALHLASIKGFEDGVQKLLDNGADMEIGNKEGWRPRELVQHQPIRALYQQALDKNQGLYEQLKEMRAQLETTLKTYNKTAEDELLLNAAKRRSRELYSFGTKLFLPDFVIVFSNAGKDKDTQESNLNRMNFQISVLRKSKFNVYLLESVNPDKFYILIGMPERYLQSACKENKMQMKLIDSYDYEPYTVENVTKFEPFRSKQRQEILEIQLNKILNLQDLKSQGLIQSYYKMHTYGGIARIKYQWVEDTKWYWPQPLNQMDDYLLEDKNQNFTSVTLLRQYFGEKIAFFFGWKSFITCFMVLIAVPGLALQLYVIVKSQEDYNNILVSFWVLYVMIWSTIIVEFWKRKTSEINYRWGTLDMLNNPDILNKTLKEDFLGDECISAVTGGLTKYQKKSRTILRFIVSVPILLGLMVLVVVIFLYIDHFKKSFTTGTSNDANNNLYKTLAGLLQGVAIQVLNVIYTYCARLFAKMENHKYEFQYERSIIYKLMAFKVLNSYFALFYIAFIQADSNFSTLFFMLLPIMLTKQINYTILNVWLPIFLYNRAEKNYFKNIRMKIIEHQLHQGMLDPEKSLDNQDIIEQYWNDVSKEDMQNLSRAVISLQEGEDVKRDNKDIAPSIKLVRHIDVDSIELNSLRQEFLDTVNFYADGFIDLGYITLFASAFPAGPFISMIMNTLEIRNKLNGFMYILKRPTCQRCAGIGDWLLIWEGFSFVSVISNVGLLYAKDERLVDLVLNQNNYSSQELQTIRTWIYICLGIAIIILKYMFQALIQDKPEWIRREEEKVQYLEQIQKEKDEKLLQASKKDKEREEIKNKAEIKKIKEKHEQLLANKDEEALDLRDEIAFYRGKCPPDTVYSKQQGDQLRQQKDNELGKSNLFKTKTEHQLKEFGVFRSTYIKIERELLIMRMKQLETMNMGTIMTCNECGKKLSIFECLKCDLTFCQACFDEYHKLIQKPNHPIRVLNIKGENRQAYEKYNIQDAIAKKEELLQKQIQNGADNVQEQEEENAMERSSTSNRSKVNVQHERWRKLEYFVLPTYEKSPLYPLLTEIFDYFKSEYIDHNGIDDVNETIDFKKVFKLKEKPESKGKFIIEESRALKMLLSMDEFCIEDKLFLNRIAFLVFKRYAQKATYKNFYNLCKILQEGFSEQKFILLLDFIDEDDSQEIEKDEIKKIFYSSFLQTLEEEKKIDVVIDNLFQNSFGGVMSKLEIGKRFIYSQEQNPMLYSFLVSLVQDRKN